MNVFEKYKASWLSVSICALLLFSSCEDKVDLDLPEGERLLVVQGWISQEAGPHHVYLSYSQPYFDSSTPIPATDAAVHLLDNEGFEAQLSETEPGRYTWADSGSVGRSYSLEIRLPDGSFYRSTPELLREPVPILDIFWEIDPDGPSEFLEQEEDQIYAVLINTIEPAGLGDNYRWRTYVNGFFKNDPFDIAVASDDFVDGNPILDFDVSGDLFFLGDTVEVVQERISRQAREFFQLMQQQTAFVGGPFDTPPAPIRGNVLNVNDPQRNALGYFGAAGRSRAQVVAGLE